jgi:hypothetical protein
MGRKGNPKANIIKSCRESTGLSSIGVSKPSEMTVGVSVAELENQQFAPEPPYGGPVIFAISLSKTP